jgi:SpoIID/LytB domain protein
VKDLRSDATWRKTSVPVTLGHAHRRPLRNFRLRALGKTVAMRRRLCRVGQNHLTRPLSVSTLGLVVALATTVLPASFLTEPAFAEPVVVIDGRGFGHGAGLSQDGAYWMGLSGRTATQILSTFYPGTTLGKQSGTVRVPLGTAASMTLAFPNGGTIGGSKVPSDASVRFNVVDGTVRSSVTSASAPAAPARLSSVAVVPGADVRLLQLIGRVLMQSSGADPAAAAQVDPASTTTTNPTETPSIEPSTTAPAEAATTAAEPVASPPALPVPDAGAPLALAPVGQSDPGLLSDDLAPTSTLPAPAGALVDAKSSGSIALGGRRYRGVIELRVAAGGLRATNVVDVEDYLRGMGEILTGFWPAAALQAQAVVARTYALRLMGTVGEVCPTQRCQVYLGAQAEYPEMDRAVEATRGRVVMYREALAATYYSASGGGTIASTEEAFGAGSKSVPYLRAGPYLSGDLKPWTVTMSMSEIGRRVGYPGSPNSVTITKVGPSGRATEVTVDGTAGPKRIGGPAFDAALGLRSTYFTFRAPAEVELSKTSVLTATSTTTTTALTAVEWSTTSTPESLEGSTAPVSARSGAVESVGRKRVVTTEASPPGTKADATLKADVATDLSDHSARYVLAMLTGLLGVVVAGVVVRWRRSRQPTP